MLVEMSCNQVYMVHKMKDGDKTKNMCQKLILITDNDPSMVRLLSRCLEDGGNQVVTATDGPTALDIIAKQKTPAVAVLETRGLGQDGVEVSRHLHEFSNMPVIILTTETLEW